MSLRVPESVASLVAMTAQENEADMTAYLISLALIGLVAIALWETYA